MGTFSNAKVHYGLEVTGTPTKTNSVGDVRVGIAPTNLAITGTVAGYSTSGIIGASAGAMNVNFDTNTFSPIVTPTAQVETATAAGTITASGNATVVVTGARITGSPVTVSVAVTNGDTAATWAGKVREALAANAAISSVYTVSGSSTSIVLTETTAVYANDSTLNISLDNGTCTGITTAATSANTTAGVAGSILTLYTGDGNDFEGRPLPSGLSVSSIIFECTSGSYEVTFALSTDAITIASGQKRIFINGLSSSSDASIVATSADARFTTTVVLSN